MAVTLDPASLASADRGELYTGEQARRILTERPAQHAG
jgi:hypothetical protein